MPSQKNLGVLEFVCDAPAYPVVQACNRLGLESPEDVRWCRLRNLVAESFWRSSAKGGNCLCGQRVPDLMHCTFTYANGTEETYILGQCERCRTILWDEP